MPRTAKTAKKSKPTAEPKERKPEWRDAYVCGASHIIAHSSGEDAKPKTHRIVLEIEDCPARLRCNFEFPLETATDVAALRRFLGPFDFPLVDERDLDAACERMLCGDCEILCVTNDDDIVVHILRVRSVEQDWVPDSKDGEEIWDHNRHRELRERETEVGERFRWNSEKRWERRQREGREDREGLEANAERVERWASE